MDVSILNSYVDKVAIPTPNDKVYKDECLLCFDTVYSDAGLFISLTTFQCYSQQHLHQYSSKSGDILFLNIKRILNEEKAKKRNNKEVTKLAIGVEGGFDVGFENDYDELHSLVCLDPINLVIPLPNDDLHEVIKLSISGILSADSAEKKEQIAAWVDDRQLAESIYAKDLVQLPPQEGQFPVSCVDCTCELCDKKDNLWLCLTCGKVLCGRRYFDGTGGNNHMVDHYDSEKHPLVVKIGTITSEGADVFSYPEEDMVADPLLKQHLEHWGIDMSKMVKSDLSMAELELNANKQLELSSITESGKDLEPLSGPGYTGLSNLGNTCYLASTMQVLFSLPEWKKRFYDQDFKLFDTLPLNEDLNSNLEVQLVKLANGIISGVYAKEESIQNEVSKESGYQIGISPRSFKNCIGKGHPEFSSNRQQDANEFLQYLLAKCENLNGGKELSNLFKYQVERRIECLSSHKVTYKMGEEMSLELPVPLTRAINSKEYFDYKEKLRQVEEENSAGKKKADEEGKSFTPTKLPETVTPIVSLRDCIDEFAAPSLLESFYSTAVKRKVNATQTTRFSTFPDYLIVQAQRYYLDGYTPKKLDVSLNDVESLDLSYLRGTGLKEGEEQLPEEDGAEEPSFNMDIVNGLVGMGFDELHAKNALLNGCTNIDSAINFIFENQGNPILTTPIPKSNSKPSSTDRFSDADPSLVEQIVSMGIGAQEAKVALHKTKNNIEAAMDMIFSNTEAIQEELNAPVPVSVESHYKDGKGQYELFAMVSHIGNNTSHGHYVAHVKINDEWVMFNDRRVVKSNCPPFGLAYLYFYKRSG